MKTVYAKKGNDEDSTKVDNVNGAPQIIRNLYISIKLLLLQAVLNEGDPVYHWGLVFKKWFVSLDNCRALLMVSDFDKA